MLIFDSVPITDAASNKLQGSNIFTIAKRTVEGQDMLYQSMKLTNGIWVLAELRVQAGNPNYTVSSESSHCCAGAAVLTIYYQKN